MLAIDAPPEILMSTDRVVAAILTLGAGLYALIKTRGGDDKKQLTNGEVQTHTCNCREEILAAEERVKLHVDAAEVEILNQLAATHRHAGNIPDIKHEIGLLAQRVDGLPGPLGVVRDTVVLILDRVRSRQNEK